MNLMAESYFEKHSNTTIFTLNRVFIEKRHILFLKSISNILKFELLLPFYMKKIVFHKKSKNNN